MVVQTPSSSSRQPILQEGTFDTGLTTAYGNGTPLATLQTPNHTVMWEMRHKPTAKTEEKAGKYKPLMVFDTAARVAGPR